MAAGGGGGPDGGWGEGGPAGGGLLGTRAEDLAAVAANFSFGDARVQQWALASYLLGKGDSATIFISAIQDYGKQHLWPEYAAPVGVPLGPAVRTTGGLVKW